MQARRFGSACLQPSYLPSHSEVEQGDESGKHGAGNGNCRRASRLGRGNVGAVGIAVTGEVDLLGLPSEAGREAVALLEHRVLHGQGHKFFQIGWSGT